MITKQHLIKLRCTNCGLLGLYKVPSKTSKLREPFQSTQCPDCGCHTLTGLIAPARHREWHMDIVKK